jgi:hypothetical protein
MDAISLFLMNLGDQFLSTDELSLKRTMPVVLVYIAHDAQFRPIQCTTSLENALVVS